MLLCMGKPISATWDQDLMEPLEAVENTPSLLEGEVEDAAKAWLQASEEYLIKPVIQDRADVNLGRQKCRESDEAAMLFNPDSDYRGIELLRDKIAVASSTFQGTTSWLIDKSSNMIGQCTFVRYHRQRRVLSTTTELCDRGNRSSTTIMCIMKSQPTPRLAGILRQQLSDMTIKTETIAATGLNFNNESPSYITEMITTLESETNKLKIFWAIETMAVIQGGISSTILNMIQSLATEMSAMDAELSMLKDQNNLTIL